MDLREAFDSVNGDVFWRILDLRAIPTKLVKLISGLHFGRECAVMCDGSISDHYELYPGEF